MVTAVKANTSMAKKHKATAASTKVDPAKTDSPKADAVKADAVKADAVKADAVKTDAVNADAVKADAAKAGSGKAGAGKAGPAKAGSAKTGRGKAGRGKSGSDANEPTLLQSTLQKIEKQFGEGSIMLLGSNHRGRIEGFRPVVSRWTSLWAGRGFLAGGLSKSTARNRVARRLWRCTSRRKLKRRAASPR